MEFTTTHHGFRDNQRRRVTCDVCKADLAAGSLRLHMERCHGVFRSFVLNRDILLEDRPPVTHHARRVARTGLYPCPVDGCPCPPLKTAPSLRRHFRNRHRPDLVTTGGEHPLPVCGSCAMQVPVPGLRHEQTQQCRHYTAQRRQHAAVVASIKATGKRFSAYSVELTDVEVFPYLGRVLSKYDDDAPAVQTRLKKARAS